MQRAVQKDTIVLENKVERATEGLRSHAIVKLENLANNTNALTIANFITAARIESNISDRYREDLIFTLCKLSDHVRKEFKKFTRDEILSFLDLYRKTEAKDPLHKWIGSYNLHRVYFVRFFRWLYSPDIEQKERPRPACVENIPKLKRKEKSIYKPSDLWTSEDDILFLKFCPSKRDRCYHAISRDLSCRPHELLKLRIKDVMFKMAGDRQYAEVLVNGKTGQRHIPLINSIPYLKDWLLDHPMGANPNSPLICGFSKSFGRGMISSSIRAIYEAYRTQFFPKLLEDPSVTLEDKDKIRELLKKPWNPYLVGRHTSLTEKSKILKEHVLRQHAGWTMGSNMPQVYLHYYGNENSQELLEVYGLKPSKEQIDKLRPKQCPNCNEPNKVDSKFCVKCRMVLSYDAYTETLDEAEKKKSEIKQLGEKYDEEIKRLRQDVELKLDKILAKVDPKKLI